MSTIAVRVAAFMTGKLHLNEPPPIQGTYGQQTKNKQSSLNVSLHQEKGIFSLREKKKSVLVNFQKLYRHLEDTLNSPRAVKQLELYKISTHTCRNTGSMSFSNVVE